ncbi:MAG: HAMP domain-containing histidine kinase [Polyangiaceae bacterium]|nr:HAMP domain-containing histidine kinase [Polyangiaceae bacterium]
MSGETSSAVSRERPSLPPTFEAPRLEELLPVDAVVELVGSFEKTCGLSVWIRSTSGVDLAGSPPDEAAAALVVNQDASLVEHVHDDGGVFIVGLLEYDHDPIGRVAVGPFAVGAVEDTSAEPPRMSLERAKAHLEHFRLTLDLIVHARQRANYAAQMHLASIEESYAEVLRKNEALEEALERLREVDHLKSSFLATISHELRTPLTSIIGYSEMLAEGMCGPLTKEQLEFVQTIRLKGDQLLRLILSLLDLSKLESGTLRMHPISVPIEAVLNDAISTSAPTASKKGVRVVLEPGPPVPYLRADPDRLRQVFVNLVDNAVKFTPKGGEVSMSARVVEGSSPPEAGGLVLLAPTKRDIEVRIKDTGIGIPPHERTRIFDPFYQVDQSSTREQGGAGLGLAIVKRIVEAHLGRIRVEENAPRGTVFVVTFPLNASGSSGARPRVELP